MSGFPYLPISTDAYLADTRHLSAEEHGAYLLLLMMAWRMPDCRLPDDDVKLARWASVSAKTWRRIRDTIMAFWTLDEGFWSQKRLNLEREFVSRRAHVSRSNGERGGRPKVLENNETDNPAGGLDVTRSKTTSTSTSKITPISPSGTKRARTQKDAGYGDPADPLFADFNAHIWAKRWKRDGGHNPVDAFRAYSKLTPAQREDCKARIERSGASIVANSSAPRYRPAMASWLNKRGWEAVEDAPAEAAAKPINWPKNIEYFRSTGEWPVGWGPRPGEPGCKVPAHLLVEQVA